MIQEFVPINAIHIVTGEIRVITSTQQMRDMGFNPSAVYKVLRGEQLHHLKYRFVR